jgi:hypothetical protein
MQELFHLVASTEFVDMPAGFQEPVDCRSVSSAGNAARRTLIRDETKERKMNSKRIMLAACATIILSVGTAQAGPCDNKDKAMHDAGAGPTVGSTGQTTGNAGAAGQHPPTSTMNRASGDTAASSQDAQKQMQGKPTAAQQAEGAGSTSAKMADQGC